MLGRFTLSGDAPPRGARTVSWLTRVGAALVVYLAVSMFHDPLPYPAREIAGAAVICLLLARLVWRWISWLRPDAKPAPLPRRVIPAMLDLLVIYVFFRMVYFDPLPGTPGLVLTLLVFPMIFGMTMWSIATCKDEVQRASAHEGFAWGALVGLCLIFAGIIGVRFWPAMSDWLQAAAGHATNGLSPAAIGFANGALYSMLVVWVSLMVSWRLWWRSKR